jgi:hypothetical protein
MTLWFIVPFTSRHILLDGELLTEAFCLYNPIKYRIALLVKTYIYVFLNCGSLQILFYIYGLVLMLL